MLAAREPSGETPQARLSMIAQITDRLARSLNFEHAMQELITGATGLLGVERGAIMLLDQGTRSLSITAAEGIDETTVRDTSIQVGFGMAGAVAETGKPLIQKLRVNADAGASAEQPDAGLCVPIAIHGKLLGVMGFEKKKTATPFQRQDIEFAQLMANQAAVAIYCDLLHEELRDELAQQAARVEPAAEAPFAQQMAAA